MIAARPQRETFTKDSPGIARAVCPLAAGLAATVVVALLLSGKAVAEPGYSFDTTSGKLPKAVIPLHYAIELTPDLASLRLEGVEAVDIEVGGPTPAAHRFHGTDQRVRPRSFLRRLPDRQRREADAVEPARARRCATDLSVLGRACLQGDVCADGHGAPHLPGGEQHAGGARGTDRAGQKASRLRADAENVELPVRVRGRRARTSHGRGGWRHGR